MSDRGHEPGDQAARLHASMFTVDTHADTPGRLAGGFDLAESHATGSPGAGCVDFPRMAEGGLVSSFFAVFLNQGPCTTEGYDRAREKAFARLDLLDQMFRDKAHLCERALDPADARRIFASGRRAIFLGLENGYPLGLDLELLDAFHARGIRYITLAHSADNDLCDSCTGRREGPERGLTAFGVRVVRRMNDLGMLVDVSHISEQSLRDVLAATQAPVIASHSCARALCEHPRNLADASLRAISANGGLVSVCLVGDFVKQRPHDPELDQAVRELDADVQARFGGWDNLPDAATEAKLGDAFVAIFAERRGDLPTVKDAVDHIDHLVRVMGIDHVGIGTDFDGGGGLADCRDVSELPRLTEELLRRGYSEPSIRKIWGENLLRVFETALCSRLAERG